MAIALERDDLFADDSLRGAALCRAYSERVDAWMRELYVTEVAAPEGVALVAVGGYGRAELCPQSDIDLMLLHRPGVSVGKVAERLWYPIWDEGLKLGHAVRTPRDAMSLAADDLDTATSLLEIRHLAGDAGLTDELAGQAAALWRKRFKRWLPALGERVIERQRRFGEVAFLLEPDLKEGRGGLRDVHGVNWAEAADRVMFEGDDTAMARPYEVLLAARVELHRRTGRAGDILLLQEQDGVAEALDAPDADAFMAEVAAAARSIAWHSDEVWDRINATLKGAGRWRSARDRPLGPGVILRDGRVHLSADARLPDDPTLMFRLAAAAAGHETRIDRSSLERLAVEVEDLPEPWTDAMRDAFVALLATGPSAIPVIEALDQKNLFVKVIPEWEPTRSKPQRNAYHTFTVDRHLCEASAVAAGLTDSVERPDLLLVGALLHDIGKGYPGDHTVVGVDLIATIAKRMGYGDDDIASLQAMVEHHLLLPDVATRRDLADEATIRFVADAVKTRQELHLLAALTEADSVATGPAAWGTWKAELVRDLVGRTDYFMGGEPAGSPAPEFPTTAQIELLEAGEQVIDGAVDRLTVVSPDRPGLFSRVAGALSLNGLDVLDAALYTHDNGMALESFRVESTLGPAIPWPRVAADVTAAVAGRLALNARLSERARRYRPSGSSAATNRKSAEVHVDVGLSERSTVLEVHAPDAIGVLYRVTRALAELDCDIQSAKVQTLGHEVVDSFYVTDREGRKIVDEAHLAEIERAVLHAVALSVGNG